ncbi:hypothetical protein BC826DRAFT_1124439 [Russula brevipes]|nr:hypothetical protein BC826DRAFT_1124439 [Russula brevipes]
MVNGMAKPRTMAFAAGMVAEGIYRTIVTYRICLAKWEKQARRRFVPLLNRKDERDEPPTLELQLEMSELIPSRANKLVTAGVSWITERSPSDITRIVKESLSRRRNRKNADQVVLATQIPGDAIRHMRSRDGVMVTWQFASYIVPFPAARGTSAVEPRDPGRSTRRRPLNSAGRQSR